MSEYINGNMGGIILVELKNYNKKRRIRDTGI
jgi:hypothetical protein